MSRQNILSLYLPAVTLALGTGIAAPAIPVFARSFNVSVGTASLVFIVNMMSLVVKYDQILQALNAFQHRTLV